MTFNPICKTMSKVLTHRFSINFHTLPILMFDSLSDCQIIWLWLQFVCGASIRISSETHYSSIFNFIWKLGWIVNSAFYVEIIALLLGSKLYCETELKPFELMKRSLGFSKWPSKDRTMIHEFWHRKKWNLGQTTLLRGFLKLRKHTEHAALRT